MTEISSICHNVNTIQFFIRGYFIIYSIVNGINTFILSMVLIFTEKFGSSFFCVTYGEICEAHTNICKGKLKLAKRTMKGHVVSIRLSCTKEKSHSYLWSSSPYLPNDEYLVNHVPLIIIVILVMIFIPKI
jgi:hypothetical protein